MGGIKFMLNITCLSSCGNNSLFRSTSWDGSRDRDCWYRPLFQCAAPVRYSRFTCLSHLACRRRSRRLPRRFAARRSSPLVTKKRLRLSALIILVWATCARKRRSMVSILSSARLSTVVTMDFSPFPYHNITRSLELTEGRHTSSHSSQYCKGWASVHVSGYTAKIQIEIYSWGDADG